ncbi:MAG: AMP-binding protein [Acidimicrobiales bacterium]
MAGPAAPDVEVGTLGFWAIAREDPSRVAIVDAHAHETTFGEMLDASDAAARGLRALGLERGDALAMVLPNVPSFLTVYLAAMSSGLYLTPVNSHLAAPEIAHVIADCEAKAVVVHADLAERAAAGVDSVGVSATTRFADPRAEGYRPLSDLAELGEQQPPLPGDLGAGAMMLYTSGTTGTPKGVRRSLPEAEPSDLFGRLGEIYCSGFGIRSGPGVHLVCGPLYHAGPSASATSALHVGHTLVLMDRWTPEACLELIQRHRVTSTQMVPTMFHRLLALPVEVRERYDISSIESVMHTGAPCPMVVKQRFMDWFGPVVYETYGGTESVATIATPRRWLQKPGTVGKAIHGVTLHILDDDGEECPVGEAGAIYVEHKMGVGAEYFKDPEKTKQMRRGNLVTLGDVGYLDDDGFLFLRDRKVDMVISGGVNIYPAEIEAVLLQSPLVADVAVIGVPDDELGEIVLAIVEPSLPLSDPEGVGRDIIDFCNDRLARFKHPRRVELVELLPRLPNGKMEKRRLREPYWEGHDRAI